MFQSIGRKRAINLFKGWMLPERLKMQPNGTGIAPREWSAQAGRHTFGLRIEQCCRCQPPNHSRGLCLTQSSKLRSLDCRRKGREQQRRGQRSGGVIKMLAARGHGKGLSSEFA